MPTSLLRRAARVGWLLLVIAAFVVAVVARRDALAERLRDLHVGWVVLGGLAAIVGVGVSGEIWRALLAGFGSHLGLRPAVRVFFVGQLGKYLPGSVWPVLAQAELGRDHHVPPRVSLAAQTVFMWVHLVTGGVVAGLLLPLGGVIGWWGVPAALVGVALLTPRPLQAVLDWVLARTRRASLPGRLTGRHMLRAVAASAVMWSAYSAHLLALAAAVDVAPGVANAAGGFAAAWCAGFLFLVAPAGAGAREAVLIAALAGATDADTALTLALLSRLVMSVADGLWGAVGLVGGGKPDVAVPVRS